MRLMSDVEITGADRHELRSQADTQESPCAELTLASLCLSW
ncbi:hypothetical protein X771_15095 [Mesorhizobium sp. LSJC277A00]|nr:hypothetical protein X771_15095 [Mesorhizobium sp. LSJC277A00]